MERKVGIISLGCPKNTVDSEWMLGRLNAVGWEPTANPEEAEVIIINTCSFILPAREEAIDTILETAELKKSGSCKRLVVTGCFVNSHGKELEKEIPEVDAFLDTFSLDKITEVIGESIYESAVQGKRIPLTFPHIAYLKIADGCNHRCGFCTIPYIKGQQLSRHPTDILKEAGMRASEGVKELILIAQDTSSWGKDLPGGRNLPDLLKMIADEKLFPWIRIMYLFPSGINEQLIETFAIHDSLLPYFDIPFQHSDENILKAMGRSGSGEKFLELISQIRKSVPGAVFRSSLIVGFPQETDESIQNLKYFLTAAQIENIGVFTYWHEEGTPAFKRYKDRHSQKKKDAWRREIMLHQKSISRELLRRFVNKKLQVIVDGTHPETDMLLAGRFYGQAPEIDGTVIITAGNVSPGEIVDVRIRQSWDYDLEGIAFNNKKKE